MRYSIKCEILRFPKLIFLLVQNCFPYFLFGLSSTAFLKLLGLQTDFRLLICKHLINFDWKMWTAKKKLWENLKRLFYLFGHSNFGLLWYELHHIIDWWVTHWLVFSPQRLKCYDEWKTNIQREKKNHHCQCKWTKVQTPHSLRCPKTLNVKKVPAFEMNARQMQTSCIQYLCSLKWIQTKSIKIKRPNGRWLARLI